MLQETNYDTFQWNKNLDPRFRQFKALGKKVVPERVKTVTLAALLEPTTSQPRAGHIEVNRQATVDKHLSKVKRSSPSLINQTIPLQETPQQKSFNPLEEENVGEEQSR